LKIDAIFRPKSVAIIGASNTRGKVGFVLANNLLKSGYDGQGNRSTNQSPISQERWISR